MSFLPIYTIKRVIYKEVYKGTMDLAVFKSFLMNLLPYYGRYPKPLSVMIIDNALFYNMSYLVKDLYTKARVLLVK